MKKAGLFLLFLLFLVAPGYAATLNSAFDAGNGVADGTFESPAGTYNIIVECDPSPADSSWGDWFYFAIGDIQGTAPVIRVDFANTRGGGPFWEASNSAIRPVWSYDQTTWYRLSSINSYSGDVLQFTLPTMAQNTVYVAMDHPYTYGHVTADVADWNESPYCTAAALSYSGVTGSQGGRSVYYMKVEEPGYYTNRFETVITARTHPGEPQASFALAGFMDWILSGDSAAVTLRRKSILHVFPMCNPDGVYAGRLRALNNGLDGNRGYSTTGPSSSGEPAETFLIHTKIAEVQSNISYAIDLHANNWASPRAVYDPNNDNWAAPDLNAVMSAVNALDNPSPDYLYDSVYSMVLAYNTGWRGGLRDQYGIDVLGLEGGIYTMDSGAYPTIAQRETGGRMFIQGFIDALEAAVAETARATAANIGSGGSVFVTGGGSTATVIIH